jgi:hypothetical protein
MKIVLFLLTVIFIAIGMFVGAAVGRNIYSMLSGKPVISFITWVNQQWPYILILIPFALLAAYILQSRWWQGFIERGGK